MQDLFLRKCCDRYYFLS